MEAEQQALRKQGDSLLAQDGRLEKLRALRDAVRDLLNIQDFGNVHWQPLALQIQSLLDEKSRIKEVSDVLRLLQEQLAETEQAIKLADKDHEDALREHSSLQVRLESDRELLDEARRMAESVSPGECEFAFPQLAAMQAEALSGKALTVENCDKSQTEMRQWLQARLDGEGDKSKRLGNAIVQQMQRYKGEYTLETAEVDAALESAGEFESMLKRLKDEDLLRHERRESVRLEQERIAYDYLQRRLGELRSVC